MIIIIFGMGNIGKALAQYNERFVKKNLHILDPIVASLVESLLGDLFSNEMSVKLMRHAATLDQINKERREIETEMREQAFAYVDALGTRRWPSWTAESRAGLTRATTDSISTRSAPASSEPT